MKKVLVTGSNKGIGKEICLQLLDLGFTVIATARSMDKLTAAFNQGYERLHLFTLDVSNTESVEQAKQKIGLKFRNIDVLINNAGIGVGKTNLSEIDLAEAEQIFNVNFFGPMRVNKSFLPLLKNSEKGRIINVASNMGQLKNLVGGYGAYRLSKAGLIAQTILLANELQYQNIEVVSMCPGWTKTDMGGDGAIKSVEKGAETAVWLTQAETLETGGFYSDKKLDSW